MRSGREWLLALLLGVVIVLWGTNVSRQSESPKTTTAEVREPPRYVVRDARWLRTDADGAPLFRVQATRLAMYADERTVIQEPTVDGLGEQDAWSLRAPRGDIPAGSRNLELSGGVDVSGEWADGSPLDARTERLTIDVSDRLLRTQQPVHVTGPGRDLRSVGLRTDWDGDRLTLLDQVRVTYDAR